MSTTSRTTTGSDYGGALKPLKKMLNSSSPSSSLTYNGTAATSKNSTNSIEGALETIAVTLCADSGVTTRHELSYLFFTNETSTRELLFPPVEQQFASNSITRDNCGPPHQDYLNSTSTDSIILLPVELRLAATIVCCLVLALGFTGNFLVPLVVCRTKELRNSTNFFLINLSIADLLVLVVCMPTVLIELHSRPEIWLLGENMCKAVPFVENTVAHGSILTILAISFERYYAICKPLKAGYKCTKFRALIIILCVWTVAIMATMPILIIAEQTEASYIDGSLVPVCLIQANTAWQKVYFLVSMGAFFWVPLCVLLLVYSIITKRLCLDDIKATSLVQHSERVQMRARRQVVLMLAAVVACFFICLLPFRILTLWLIFSSADQIKSLGMETYYTLLYISRIMLYLNSAINPILYNLISSKFREAFVGVLCCKRHNRLLIRQTTFNTTSSSLVMSSLKNSLHRAAQAANVLPSDLKHETCSLNLNGNKEFHIQEGDEEDDGQIGQESHGRKVITGIESYV